MCVYTMIAPSGYVAILQLHNFFFRDPFALSHAGSNVFPINILKLVYLYC